MMIKIKDRGEKLVDIKFSEWIRRLEKGQKESLVLLAFFVPGRYPSFSLSFTDGKHRIKKSFSQQNEEIVKELRKWYKKVKGAKGKVIFTVEKTEEGVILDLSDIVEDSNYQYREDINGSLILKRTETQREDIPF